MSILTPSQRLLVDTHPQRTKLFLSIFEPDVVFVCTVTGSYNTSTQSITYMDGSGSTGDIISGLYQTALIGTVPNDDSKGRTWVRYSTGTNSLRFVESDHINWAGGDVVTVLNFTEIIPLFPRIIQNPADETDVIFYKVWDIPYTNQNDILGTFVNMGCHYAGFRDDDDGLYKIYWTASGTSNLIGDNLTYLWEFPVGCNPTGSTDHTPGWVSYPTGGHYRNILRVTSDSAREDISVRFSSLYDRPEKGSFNPILNWELSEPYGGSRDSTGYTCRIKVRGDVSKSKIKDGSLVIIFADEWYGTTKQSVGIQENRNTIKFVGYVKDGTITTNYLDHSIEFDVHSPTGVMEYSECFSCSVESKTSPTTWYELKDMNIQKAIYHYLAWQSTVLQVCDVRSNFVDQYIQYFDADRTSLYDAVNTLISGARRGRIISDRYGKIWLEQDAEAIVSGSSAFPVALDLTKHDWIGDPVIDEKQTGEVAFIEMGGIAYYPSSGSLGSFSALLCDAPGSGPRYQGKVERIQGLALADQTELNDMAGQMLAWYNARYPNVEYKLRGNFANLDIAPQEIIRITMKNTENNRGISWTDKDFVIRGINWNWDADNLVTYPTVRLAEVVNGFPATTVIIPDVPPTEGDGGDFEQPSVYVPPLPVTTPLVTGTYSGHAGDDFLYLYFNFADYDEDDSSWEDYNPAILGFGNVFNWSSELVDQRGMWSDSDPSKIYIYDVGMYHYVLNVYIEFSEVPEYPDSLVAEIYLKLYNSSNTILHTYFAKNKMIGLSDEEVGLTLTITGWFSKYQEYGPNIFDVHYVKAAVYAYNDTDNSYSGIRVGYTRLQIYRISNAPLVVGESFPG